MFNLTPLTPSTCGRVLALAVLLLVACSKPAPLPMDTEAVVGRVLPAVVRIEAIQMRPNDGRLVKAWTGGSGVIISPDGFVVTNFHVAQDAEFFRCYLTDGRTLDAHRVGQDPLTDLAVLKLTPESGGTGPFPFASFGDTSALKPGQPVFALGSPGFFAQSVTRGIIANPSVELPQHGGDTFVLTMNGENVGMVVRWILHDAVIYHGNSGGPLVNDRGEVIGINEIGVFNLSGAIPGRLVQRVAQALISSGSVVRGWSGITVQPRLEADGEQPGVSVSDVAEGSPAARAGVVPGDVILSVNGRPIAGQKDAGMGEYYQDEMDAVPGSPFLLERLHAGAKGSVTFALERRLPAEAPNVESKAWGMIERDVTRHLALLRQLPDTHGVEVVSVRPGGPAGQAEPRLLAGDVIVQIDSAPVRSGEDFRAATAAVLKHARNGVRLVVASFRRGGALMATAVQIRAEVEPPAIVPEVRKGWLGIETQPLTSRLAAHWKIHGPGGVRVTRIYPHTSAAKSGLRVGDVVLALDDTPIPARREEDTDVFSRRIRDYDPGAQAELSLWRAGARLKVPVTIEEEPQPPGELPTWEDQQLEFTVREAAFADLAALQLDPATKGVLVAETVPSGWASLGGLRAGDLIVAAGGHPIATLADFRAARQEPFARKERWWVLLVRRNGSTALVQIDLKPITS